MFHNDATTARRRNGRLAAATGLLLVGGMGGAVMAATNPASAATITAAAVTSPSTAPAGPADTATPVRAGEVAVTGADLATAKAAALKAVPGGTVYRVESDADGASYEAHMFRADGTRVTVKFDKSFAVTAIQDGMGSGGPGGAVSGTAPATGGTA